MKRILAALCACGPVDEPVVVEPPVQMEPVETPAPVETPDPTPEPTPDPGVPVEVRYRPVHCDEPATDVAYDRMELPPIQDPEPTSYALDGGGITVADFDGNGLLDLWIAGRLDRQLFMQHEPMVFTDEVETRIGEVGTERTAMSTAADYDGDGDLDLVLARYQRLMVLLANDGEGVFTDVTDAAGLRFDSRSQSASLGDMDGDGDLDLVIGSYGAAPLTPLETEVDAGDPSSLWENLGDGTFADRSSELPEELQQSHTFMTAWQDMDLDGDEDLLFINDFGWSRPGGVLWNTPGGLMPDEGSAGLDIPFAGMGLGVGDLNHDEIPDLLQSSWRSMSLLVSREGFWVEEATPRGLWPIHERAPHQRFGWGAELADIDNDGDDDAIVAYGHWERYGGLQGQQGDAVFIQGDDGQFVDEAVNFGMRDNSVTRGLLLVDLNDDGHLDVIKRRIRQATTIDVSRCTDRAWLRVRLRMGAPNPFAVGARVRVIGPDRVWSRPIHAGGASMYTSGPPEVHVGLGDLDRVEVQVVWPGGEVSNLGEVDTRQILDVERVGDR